jgi:hypothetical protein
MIIYNCNAKWSLTFQILYPLDSVAEQSEEFKNTVFISQKTKDAIVDQISGF